MSDTQEITAGSVQVTVAPSATPTTVTVASGPAEAAGDNTDQVVAAHDQAITHRYMIHFPNHTPRANDPHYAAFEAFKKKTKATAQCAIGARFGDFSMCTLDRPLEVHHRIIEFAVQNEVDLKALEIDFPEVETEEELAAFVESDKNFVWLCVFHHRGHGGAHTAAYADYEAQMYVKGLIT